MLTVGSHTATKKKDMTRCTRTHTGASHCSYVN